MMKFTALGSIVSATASAVLLSGNNANAASFSGYDVNIHTTKDINGVVTAVTAPLTSAEATNSTAAFASFSAQLNGTNVTTESFETANTPLGTPIDGLSTVISGITANFSYKTKDIIPVSATGGSSTKVQKSGANGNPAGFTNSGTYPTDGFNGISINSSNTFSITFSSRIAAFGYFGTDLGDLNNALTMHFFNGTTLLNPSELAIQVPNSSKDGSEYFFGFIADSPAQYFDKVVFDSSKTGDAIGIDQIKIGTAAQITTPVPEPSSLVGTLLFGGSIAMIKRRQRRARSIIRSDSFKH
jgi:hypothetical protein